ncbi:MAG: diacylglycerol kinase family protein [Spirochaetota bacterium]
MKRFAKSATHALRGILTAVVNERNVRIHCGIAVLAVILGFVLGISLIEWALIIFAIGLVLSAELINTAVEHLADRVSRKHDLMIAKAKDTAAGGVLIAALAAAAVGVLVLAVPAVKKAIELVHR